MSRDTSHGVALFWLWWRQRRRHTILRAAPWLALRPPRPPAPREAYPYNIALFNFDK